MMPAANSGSLGIASASKLRPCVSIFSSSSSSTCRCQRRPEACSAAAASPPECARQPRRHQRPVSPRSDAAGARRRATSGSQRRQLRSIRRGRVPRELRLLSCSPAIGGSFPPRGVEQRAHRRTARQSFRRLRGISSTGYLGTNTSADSSGRSKPRWSKHMLRQARSPPPLQRESLPP